MASRELRKPVERNGLHPLLGDDPLPQPEEGGYRVGGDVVGSGGPESQPAPVPEPVAPPVQPHREPQHDPVEFLWQLRGNDTIPLPQDPEFAEQMPALWRLMTLQTTPDGKSRLPATLEFSIAPGGWQACLRDHHSEFKMTVVAPEMGQTWVALEKAIHFSRGWVRFDSWLRTSHVKSRRKRAIDKRYGQE